MSMRPGRIVHMTAFNKARKGDLFAFLLLGVVSDDRKEKQKERAKIHKANVRRQAVEGPGAEVTPTPERSFPGPFDGPQELPSIYRVLLSQLDFRRPQDLGVFEIALNLSARLQEMTEADRASHVATLKKEFPELLQILKAEG